MAPAAGGLALLLSAAVANGDTTIDPGSVGGQVWTADKSPYHVGGMGDLTVAVGEELRIEAGTVVRFSNPTGAGTLAVQGSLKVNGTAAAPVILEGEPGSTGQAWYGIMGYKILSVSMTNALVQATWTISSTDASGHVYGSAEALNAANQAGDEPATCLSYRLTRIRQLVPL